MSLMLYTCLERCINDIDAELQTLWSERLRAWCDSYPPTGRELCYRGSQIARELLELRIQVPVMDIALHPSELLD